MKTLFTIVHIHNCQPSWNSGTVHLVSLCPINIQNGTIVCLHVLGALRLYTNLWEVMRNDLTYRNPEPHTPCMRNRQCNMGCAIIIKSPYLNGSVTNTACTTSGRTQICRVCSTKCTNNLLLLLHTCLKLT